MYKLRPFLPLNVMKNVYYSLIYSHIIYAIEVWGSAFNSIQFNSKNIFSKTQMILLSFKLQTIITIIVTYINNIQ